MVGKATLTIVTSMMLMNMAATKTTLTATFWLMRASTTFLSSACPRPTPATPATAPESNDRASSSRAPWKIPPAATGSPPHPRRSQDFNTENWLRRIARSAPAKPDRIEDRPGADPGSGQPEQEVCLRLGGRPGGREDQHATGQTALASGR